MTSYPDPSRPGETYRHPVRDIPQGGPVTRLLGDSPVRVAIRLLVMSLGVGLLMAFIDWTPADVWYWTLDAIDWVVWLVRDQFGAFGRYLLWGASIVIPLFILGRLLSLTGRR